MAPAGSEAANAAAHRSWGGAAVVAGAAAAAMLGGYLAHELLGAFVFPVGPDGPVYAWWMRYADSLGLEGIAPARPGIPAAGLVLGTALGTTPVQTVMLLGPVLATSAGLAAGAVMEAALGADRRRAAVTAILTGTFASYLAGGWLANMGQATLFIAALASLALADRSWRAVWAGGALLAASAVTHALFALVGAAIVAAALAPAVPEVVRSLRRGEALGGIPSVRAAVATLGAVAGAGLSAITLAGGIPGDTSQDGFFRRTGLERLLRDRYAERLGGDLVRLTLPLATGAGLAVAGALPWGSRPALPEDAHGRRFLRRVLAAWAAVTVVGVAVLALTLVGPPNRLLVFAFVVPLTAAAGAGVLLARRRPGWTAVVVIAVGLFAGGSMYGWYRQYPSFAPEELAAAVQAGQALRGQPPGTPVVFLVDAPEPASAFHATRAANVIRMGVPPHLIRTTRVVVGRPDDVLAGRPTLTGDAEHDRIARTYLKEASPVLDEAWVLALEPLNRQGFPAAVDAGSLLSPAVAVVDRPPDAGTLEAPRPVDGFSLGLSPAGVVLLTAAALALLAILGGGWARWGLPGASRLAAVSAAPATGLGVAVLAGFGTDRVAPGAASPWGLGVAAALAVAGYVAARRSGQRGRR